MRKNHLPILIAFTWIRGTRRENDLNTKAGGTREGDSESPLAGHLYRVEGKKNNENVGM
jgi:hypothetical protein